MTRTRKELITSDGTSTLYFRDPVLPPKLATSSWRNGLTVSVRQRLSSLALDFNYTFSHSLDDASGQSETGFGNANGNGAFIVNPIRQRDNYASSDFDIRHLANADAVWQLPFGKGRAFYSYPTIASCRQ
jgi:hypothetical protein